MTTKVKCTLCKDIIESKGPRHNMVVCKCGKSFADGGDSYHRWGGEALVWDEEKKAWRKTL